MVSSKLGVGSIERGVAVGFRFLDPGEKSGVSLIPLQGDCAVDIGYVKTLEEWREERGTHPFLWAFLF